MEHSEVKYDFVISDALPTEAELELYDGINKVTETVDSNFITSNRRNEPVVLGSKELIYEVSKEEHQINVKHQISDLVTKTLIRITRIYDEEKILQRTDIETKARDVFEEYQLLPNGRLSVLMRTAGGTMTEEIANPQDVANLNQLFGDMTSGL